MSSSPGTGGRSKVPPRPRRELSQCRSLEVSVGQGGSPWRRAAGSFLEFTAAAPPAASPAFAKWVYEVEGVLGRAGAGARLLPRAHSPDRESPGNPRFPLTSAPSTLPAAASPRLGAGEVGGGGGRMVPHPRTSEPRQPTRYLHVEDIYRSLGMPAVDRSFQSQIRLRLLSLLLLLFCSVQSF